MKWTPSSHLGTHKNFFQFSMDRGLICSGWLNSAGYWLSKIDQLRNTSTGSAFQWPCSGWYSPCWSSGGRHFLSCIFCLFPFQRQACDLWPWHQDKQRSQPKKNSLVVQGNLEKWTFWKGPCANWRSHTVSNVWGDSLRCMLCGGNYHVHRLQMQLKMRRQYRRLWRFITLTALWVVVLLVQLQRNMGMLVLQACFNWRMYFCSWWRPNEYDLVENFQFRVFE